MDSLTYTQGIALRPIEKRDLESIYLNGYGNAAFMQRFKLNAQYKQHELLAQFEQREQQTFDQRSYKEFVIVHHCDGVIGLAILADHNAFHQSAEILVGLFHQRHQRGSYGLTATLLLLDKAFNQYHLNRLNSYVYGHNQYACRCTEKLGFTAEGLRKDYIYSEAHGGYVNVHCYGLRGVDFRKSQQLARQSRYLLGRDITASKEHNSIPHKPQTKLATGLLSAAALCSTLAMAPAYGKTSSSSSDTSAVVNPSEGKTASSGSSNSSSSSSTGSSASSQQNNSQQSYGGQEALLCTDSIHQLDTTFDPLDPLLFDVSLYQQANPDLKGKIADTQTGYQNHWISSGINKGRLASLVFDAKYYLQQNSDLQQKYSNDLEGAAKHWLSKGIYEGRIASPAFDVQYYLSANPDIYAAYGSDFRKATLHWLNKGINEDRPFSAQLDVDYYLQQNSHLSAYAGNRRATVIHWLLYGQLKGLAAAPQENQASELLSCDVTGSMANTEPSSGNASSGSGTSSGNNGSSSASNAQSKSFSRASCSNNMRGIRNQYTPLNHLIYSNWSYKLFNPDLIAQFGDDNQAYQNHWQNNGLKEGRIGSPAFDAQYYLESNPDLKNIYANDYEAAAKHWVEQGIYEGRKSSPVFDVQYYLADNPDLYDVYGGDFNNATQQWLARGIAEGRVSSEDFNIKDYLERNSDVANQYGNNYSGVIAHWLLKGSKENRVAVSPNIIHPNAIDCNLIGSNVNLYKSGDYIDYFLRFKAFNKSTYQEVKGTDEMTMRIWETDYSNPNANQVLKMTYTSRIAGVYTSSKSYVYNDKHGNFMNYLSKIGKCLNSNDCDKGVLIFPVDMYVGRSWGSHDSAAIFGSAYGTTEYYSVDQKEVVETPIGQFDTYRVFFNASFDAVYAHEEDLKMVGHFWYKPGFGIVKMEVDATFSNYYTAVEFDLTITAVETNIAH